MKSVLEREREALQKMKQKKIDDDLNYVQELVEKLVHDEEKSKCKRI
jgi:hypothetical protein